MKMPSTYISLLLLCGLMLLFYSTQKRTGHKAKPALVRPMVKRIKPVEKRALSEGSITIDLSEGRNEQGFSFFSDVLANLAPALKYLK